MVMSPPARRLAMFKPNADTLYLAAIAALLALTMLPGFA
jgi:hypothetical protein